MQELVREVEARSGLVKRETAQEAQKLLPKMVGAVSLRWRGAARGFLEAVGSILSVRRLWDCLVGDLALEQELGRAGPEEELID